MHKEAWLIFRDGDHRLGSILRKDFGHVNVLFKDDYNWIEIAPDKYALKVEIFPFSITEDVPSFLIKAGMRVFKVVYEEEIKSKFFPRLLIGFSCVSFIKYFLGYKDYSITPYGLCKNLTKLKKNIIQYGEVL